MSNPDQSPDERAAFVRWLCESFPAAWTEQSAAHAWDNNEAAVSAWHSAREPLLAYERMFNAACLDLAAINEALDLDPDDGGAVPILEAIAELKSRVAPTEAAAMAATVPAALTDLFCQAMAWGAVYHPIVATSQWDKLRDDMAANFVKLAAQAPVAGQPAEPSPADPIRGLLQAHEDLIEQGENYAYFELAYTRRTGWMAWLTDRPASGEPGTAEYAKSRKVIAQGQGDSAEEACQDALDVMAAPKGDSNG